MKLLQIGLSEGVNHVVHVALLLGCQQDNSGQILGLWQNDCQGRGWRLGGANGALRLREWWLPRWGDLPRSWDRGWSGRRRGSSALSKRGDARNDLRFATGLLPDNRSETRPMPVPLSVIYRVALNIGCLFFDEMLTDAS